MLAGADLQSVARDAATALGITVAISMPGLQRTTSRPAGVRAVPPKPGEGIGDGSDCPTALDALDAYAMALHDNPSLTEPRALPHTAPIRVGQDVVGVVAALPEANAAADDTDAETAAARRAWLEGLAAAAAIATLLAHDSDSNLEQGRRSFLEMLEADPGAETGAVLARAQRLGCDLSHGVLAFAASLRHARGFSAASIAADGLLAELGDERLLGLAPLSPQTGAGTADAVLAELRAAGLPAVAAAPRATGESIQAALREAALLLELLLDDQLLFAAHQDTFRLLVGVMLRWPGELEALYEATIGPLVAYDSEHDTELVATLETFLAHHGSTTDTAVAMQLHRHTVGYRLARLHEVAQLSPYESGGRERLGLGLKASRIMLAEARRAGRARGHSA